MKTLTPLPDRIAAWFTMLLVVFLLFGASAEAQLIDRSDTIEVRVTRVVDGDTFFCTAVENTADTVKVRILNLDTFEKINGERLRDQARRMNVSDSVALKRGFQATDIAKKLLLGQTVTLHRGTRREANVDKYGRVLRYVMLEDGKDYSELMKEKGYNVKR
jgi:micrococcal nuclease